MIPDSDNPSSALFPDERPHGELLPRATIIPLTMAAILAVATAIECHAQTTGIQSVLSWGFSLAYGSALWFWWALVVYLLWRSTSRWPFALRISIRTLVMHLLLGLAVVTLHLAFLQESTRLIVRLGPEAVKADYRGLDFFYFPRFGMELLLYGLCWLACAAVNTQLAAQHDSMRSLELERQLSSAHLRALQMQLEPHFLFNTLNAVTTLVELGRREQALETLEHLNTVMKLVLKRNTPSRIPLAQELEVLESYLAIEQVRFADRLRVDINLDPKALDGLVPCFLLQPIVENAIRHGIAHREDGGWIETSAQRVGTLMRLQVRDNGPGMNRRSANGFGLGLSNTKERLAHFYQDNYELRAFQPESGGFQVSITIPYEKATS
ncbi:MAG: sensor histidine kinase [Acidobacteria bacterium]|nr:sensor histidine kinase [Acidobacteriota bacterium]